MRIFVWKRWGQITLLHADTHDQLVAIGRRLRESVEGWGDEEEEFDRLNERIATMDVAHTLAEITNQLRDVIGWHETFEYGTGFVICGEP